MCLITLPWHGWFIFIVLLCAKGKLGRSLEKKSARSILNFVWDCPIISVLHCLGQVVTKERSKCPKIDLNWIAKIILMCGVPLVFKTITGGNKFKGKNCSEESCKVVLLCSCKALSLGHRCSTSYCKSLFERALSLFSKQRALINGSKLFFLNVVLAPEWGGVGMDCFCELHLPFSIASLCFHFRNKGHFFLSF